MPKIYKRKCDYCGKEYKGEGRYFCSVKCRAKKLTNSGQFKKGQKFPKEWRKKNGEAHKGKPGGMRGKKHSGETKRKMSKAQIKRVKEGRNHLFKGGISKESYKIRQGIEIRLWRESVFARDNWICQKCEERSGNHNAHHILNFGEFPELRTAIDNGITFCENCHKKFHKKFGYRNNTKEQITNFII